MILIGLGANLPGANHGSPRDSLAAAILEIEAEGVSVTGRSGWYSSAPVPASDQPDYVNAVAALETDLAPGPLLTLLHDIETRLGRARTVRNAARIIDIDLLDYHGKIDTGWPILPHPRMADRAFVLRPLRDVAPDWCHPVTGERVAALLARAADREDVRPLKP
ncbi:MAG: 2-amino-4-hydroxy-6-hydroxymethyldihydropteridine diphosphokinase [Rhodospirillaceae bacterium]|jgi:2-amino-4-hydroxy-6-hydroxymethyldihydropteridine diphosphokinase|nr:2-amino-4-hydroxy-6-hydroxymethyldihydropteridine diphosphokinase [Rhodospirillaceae bacterium]MBT6404430.1 2-amino-4-hydroxy-6-hydroxymethyldihydropteridine diphosphokinase [Rhodospirillaceae bacterium]MBT6536411.1 2-amino-4-hydroxy-6-hydroxymethyldihydropteridine diphosphokinase [Rhodospirillaceae bacterium]MBT7362219.1 2-amino-4-hydroxy-6-hydroxymethyldihydropteridine diphosphokinase [Rhodospirillaceae bacterium]